MPSKTEQNEQNSSKTQNPLSDRMWIKIEISDIKTNMALNAGMAPGEY